VNISHLQGPFWGDFGQPLGVVIELRGERVFPAHELNGRQPCQRLLFEGLVKKSVVACQVIEETGAGR
jgi:hypothetical protein